MTSLDAKLRYFKRDGFFPSRIDFLQRYEMCTRNESAHQADKKYCLVIFRRVCLTSRAFLEMHRNFHFRFHGYCFQAANGHGAITL